MEFLETKPRKTTRRQMLRLVVLSAVGAGITVSARSLVEAALAARNADVSRTTSGSSSSSNVAFTVATPASSSRSTTTAVGDAVGTPSPASLHETKVKVMYFQMPLTVGATEEYYVLQNPACFRDLLTDVLERHPVLSRMIPTMMILIDGVAAQPRTALRNGDEVDFIPAIAGG